MEGKTLHILNGDATRYIFEKTSLEGDIVVWREMMAEGPLDRDIRTPAFWRKREAFLKPFLAEIEEAPLPDLYQSLADIQLTAFQEIVLWFEYDLFCHINLLAALQWLRTANEPLPTVSLICAGREPGHEKLMGLGELAPEDYDRLFENRVRLSASDRAFAAKAWEAYVAEDHTDLWELIQGEIPAVFPYFKSAFLAHFSRFPDPKTGLNHPESQTLSLSEPQPIAVRKLVGTLLRNQGYFGFGDLQYFALVEDMAPLFTKTEEGLSPSPLAQRILAGEASYASHRKKNLPFGGTDITRHHWDNPQQEFLA